MVRVRKYHSHLGANNFKFEYKQRWYERLLWMSLWPRSYWSIFFYSAFIFCQVIWFSSILSHLFFSLSAFHMPIFFYVLSSHIRFVIILLLAFSLCPTGLLSYQSKWTHVLAPELKINYGNPLKEEAALIYNLQNKFVASQNYQMSKETGKHIFFFKHIDNTIFSIVKVLLVEGLNLW